MLVLSRTYWYNIKILCIISGLTCDIATYYIGNNVSSSVSQFNVLCKMDVFYSLIRICIPSIVHSNTSASKPWLMRSRENIKTLRSDVLITVFESTESISIVNLASVFIIQPICSTIFITIKGFCLVKRMRTVWYEIFRIYVMLKLEMFFSLNHTFEVTLLIYLWNNEKNSVTMGSEESFHSWSCSGWNKEDRARNSNTHNTQMIHTWGRFHKLFRIVWRLQ